MPLEVKNVCQTGWCKTVYCKVAIVEPGESPHVIHRCMRPTNILVSLELEQENYQALTRTFDAMLFSKSHEWNGVVGSTFDL